MKRTVMLSWGVALLVGVHTGLAQVERAGNAVPSSGQTADGSAEITADKFEVEQKTGWVTATGNVRVRTGDHELQADWVRLQREQGEVQARGNVVLQQRGFGSWSGDYLEYNFKTGRGLTGSGDFKAGEFRVLAREVSRREDGRYEAKYMQVTTCTNAPGHWHWCVSGHGQYQENEWISVRHAVTTLFGIPCGYFPFLYREIDPNYGFRFVPGYTSKWGAYLLGTYVYSIYDAPRENGARLSGSTHVDYRTRRGIAAGQNFNWDLKELGRGRLETYYAWDQDPPDDSRDLNWVSDVSEDRYRIRLRHTADFTPRDQFILRGTYVSDSEMSGDFFDRDNRGESVPLNIASLSHREHGWSAGAMVSGPLNDFYGGVARTPEGWLSIMPQPIFNTGFNYESQTRAGYLNRDAAKYERAMPQFMYNPGQWADYNLARVDTAHRVTYPFMIDDVVSVVPRAGYRGTYYSEAEFKHDAVRHSGDFGVEVSTRASSELGNGYLHVVEPYVDYSFQPTQFDSDNGDPYVFDRFDHSYGWQDQFGMDGVWLPYDWHGIRPGVRNLLQARDENNRLRTVFEWDAYAGVQFDSEGPVDETGVRMLGSKMTFSPTRDLDLRALAEWDTEEKVVAYTDLSAFYKINEHVRLGGGYLGRDHDLHDYRPSLVPQWNRVKENLLYGGLTHDINETWSWSFYVRYDLRYNELDEVGGYVQYSLDCLVFQIRTAYINDFGRIDGVSDRGSDFRIAFLMWLKAENRKSRDQWLTW